MTGYRVNNTLRYNAGMAPGSAVPSAPGRASNPIAMCHNGGMKSVNLTDHFLISMPAMADDPLFGKSLTYICEHNEQGALGIMVNRPLEMSLKALMEHIGLPVDNERLETEWIYLGGPVNMDRGFVLHQPIGDWQATLDVNGEVGLTSSKDILEAVAAGQLVDRYLVSLGFAGWTAGQLEHELAQNSWLTVKADVDIIFALPAEQRFNAAMQMLGIDLASLAEEAGHA